ncbi:MAG: stage II sporulation protein R [Ruminococcus sp.]|jgi:stage II sporulation protein R|nr:stage II sporulation protein R [Ruminococcus sp.]
MKRQSKRILIIEAAAILGLIITIVINSITTFAAEVETITDNVLRLHILANSDSDEDQALKLLVRDAILTETAVIFENADGKEEAVMAAKKAVPEIERIADRVIAEQGYDYDVSVSVTTMEFDTRVYGDITMPAGEYEAIRVTIGEAEGKNWWCVMFPPLCIPAVAADETIEVFNEVLTESEKDILQNPVKYEARFFIVDLINDIKSE